VLLASVGTLTIALVLATQRCDCGLRSVLGLRELSILTESHRLQALTDDLTGLGNRRQLMLCSTILFLGTHAVAKEHLALL